MFKAQPLNRVGQLNVDAEIVRIEFKLVTVSQGLIFLHVHREPGNLRVDRQLPVFVVFGRSLKVNHLHQYPVDSERVVLNGRSNVRSTIILLAARVLVKARQARLTGAF